ncbi:SDR family NAD(P)-dependent oxidoreductase [Pedobacter sp. L105]|uniref:SDR family NAD(P)-dependent oxidoreductase n=1 Tax=Pedobacter sp. L105 TaxID=1641871 RepID=UPI00131EAFC9|nr:SDR family NAD(P)-dependent oxidoreductase [Pedobacter sp. L105]
MNIQNKKALITGGGSGIGFSIAKTFTEGGAHVILVGRNEEKLKSAVGSLKNAEYIVADVSSDADVKLLVETVKFDHGGIDILINNAGVSFYVPAVFSEEFKEKTKQEMDINFHAVVNLINQFLPDLRDRGDAAIVNVASVLAYVPSIYAVTYSASKAALHSYSQSLRLHLEREDADVKVFEVFPPLVDTEMTAGLDTPKIAPEVIAKDLIKALLGDNFSVRSGVTEDMYRALLASPENALAIMNSN